MKNTLLELHRKMDEIIGRQDRTLTMIAQVGKLEMGPDERREKNLEVKGASVALSPEKPSYIL